MRNLFSQVLNMSMTGSAVILLVMLARLMLKRSPKIFSYALWLVVLFRLLCPVAFTAPVSVLNALEPEIRETSGAASVVYFLPAEANRNPDFTFVPAENQSGSELAQAGESEHAGLDIMAIVPYVWIAGTGSMILYSIVQYIRLRRKLVGAVAYTGNVYRADYIDTPFVMGILAPKIYLPSNIPTQEQKYIIAHERHHIRRCDHIIKLLAYCALCIHWFNPLAWAAFILAGKDMEMSCDEKVLELIGKARKKEYSMALLQFASEKPIQSLSMPLGFGEPNVKSRIQHVLKYKKAAVGTGAAAVILIVAGIWLMAGRTGKAQLSEGDEKAVQEQTTEALSDSGAKTTSENETEVASQDEEQVSGEIEQSEETVPAQTSSMPFAVGYDAQETDSTTYLGSDSVQSSYALLVDLDDNTIVSQKSAYDRINPASMTKILTVLVAAEHVTDLDDTFIITKEITDFSYSHDCSAVGFLDEETVTVRDLLYGTILPSGGDAAAGLACYVAGSMDSFVNMMNEKLAELGLSDTAHFTNCVGLYDENHYCSIYDMAMILKAAVENDLAREVLTAHTYTTSATEQHPEGITISNWFLRRIEDKDTKGTVVCAKTGFVAQSGNCAASYEETDSGKHYICVTANAHSSWRCIYDHVAVYQEYTK